MNDLCGKCLEILCECHLPSPPPECYICQYSGTNSYSELPLPIMIFTGKGNTMQRAHSHSWCTVHKANEAQRRRGWS